MCCIFCAGLPFTASGVVDVKRRESGLSAELALRTGAQELKLKLQTRTNNSAEFAGRLLVSAPLSISPQFQWFSLITWFIFPSVHWFMVIFNVNN